MQKVISHKIISAIRAKINPNRLPYLTIASNVFLGFALGRIIVMPAEELTGSIFVKVLLIIGTCLFFNYLLYTRRAAKGIRYGTNGKIRPLLKELFLCAAVNASMLFLSLSLFVFRSLS